MGGQRGFRAWEEKTVKVDDLQPFEQNPRRISKEQYAKLKSSIEEMGYHQRIIATHDLRVIGGHQRIKVLKDLGVTEVPVVVAPGAITDEDFLRVMVQDNLAFGDWDFDLMSSLVDAPQLIDWGFPDFALGLGKEGIEAFHTMPPEKQQTDNDAVEKNNSQNPEKNTQHTQCPSCGHTW